MLVASLALSVWLIRKDSAQREGVTAATWIPTLWVGILCSRPLSGWLGTGGGVDTLDGSPADRFFYLIAIALSLAILAQRRINWTLVLVRSWPIVIFYVFLLVSVIWANSPLVSFKRWFKEAGNIFIALVILTEPRPLQAFRAVFIRCAYLLIPLSIVFIRYFPEWGRSYNRAGAMQLTGVTTQKNTLGAMILVCGLVLIWELVENSLARDQRQQRGRFERILLYLLALAGAWLIYLSDSKTSMMCLILGGAIIASLRYPILRQRVRSYGFLVLLGAVAALTMDQAAGFTQWLVTALGRDATLTGRTDVWEQLLNLRTDPYFGTGFMSFWDDRNYQSKLPFWVSGSAHNGYLEIYLAGGYLGLGILALMLFGVGLGCRRSLRSDNNYAFVRFAVFIVAVVSNLAESNFACMTSVGFLFLLANLNLWDSGAPPSNLEVSHLPGDTTMESETKLQTSSV